MAENTPLDSPETLQSVDAVDGVTQDTPVVTPEVAPQEEVSTPSVETPEITVEDQIKPPVEEELKAVPTKPDETFNAEGNVFKDPEMDLDKIAKNPNLNTVTEAVQKHTIPNRPKALLIQEAMRDPSAMIALMSTGAIGAEDVAQQRNQIALQTTQTDLEAIQKAWIKAPENNVFAASANIALHAITGAADIVLAVPDAAITHYNVIHKEAENDTDLAYQTFLVGTTKLRELETIIENPTSTDAEKQEAINEHQVLDNALTSLNTELRKDEKFEQTQDRYLSGYYEDQAINFVTKMRESIKVGNNEALDTLSATVADVVDTNLDTLALAKSQLDEGNLLGATGSFLSGVAGLTAETISAMAENPRGILDLTAYSMGQIAGTVLLTRGVGAGVGAVKAGVSIPNKVGALIGYQSLFATDAYQAFEQEYGHLPEAQQALILNGLAGLAAFVATSGDEFMVGSLAKLTRSAHSIKTTAFKDVMTGVPVNQAKATARRLATAVVPKRTLGGAAAESVQEFTESLIVQYAGTQDWDKVSGQDALVEGLLASGAGGLTGAVGDIGNAFRGVRKGNFESTLGKAKEGFTATRNEIPDVETFVEVNEAHAQNLNTTVESLSRDKDGNIEPTQENLGKVASLYDATVRLVGGLDSIFADIPAFKALNVRDALTKEIQAGTPVNEALIKVMGAVQGAMNPQALVESLQKNPEAMQKIVSVMQQLAPEQQAELGNDINGLAEGVSLMTGQITNYVSALVQNFDLEEMAKGVDAQTSQQRKDLAKAKLDKKKAAEQAKVEEEVAPVRERSKFTVEETINQFNENQRSKESNNAETTTAEETQTETPIAEEVSETEVETIANENIDSDAEGGVVRESPTTAQPQYVTNFANNTRKENIPLNTKSADIKTLADVNARMRGMLTNINNGKDTDGKLKGAYIGMMRSLGYQLETLSKKKTLTDADKATIDAITNAIASYAYGYAQSTQTNNADLKALYEGKIRNANFSTITKGVKAAGHSLPVNPFVVISGFGKQGTKQSGTTKSADSTAPQQKKTKGALDRDADSVKQTKRKGVITTKSLIDLKQFKAFTMLGGLIHGIFEGDVTNAPQEMVDEVANLGATSEFDTLYTELKNQVENLQKTTNQIFKTSRHQKLQEDRVANAYLALASYFKRNDPDGRDLTYVLAMHSPEVYQAMDTVLESAPIESEFSSKLNKVAKELVFEETPTNPEEFPKDAVEKQAMVLSGLEAIQTAGKETAMEFIRYVVSEGLDKTGDTVNTLKNILMSDNIRDYALPLKLVNNASIERINKFVNHKSLPNRAKEADAETETTWSGNLYNGVQEAMARLKLATNKLNMFNIEGDKESTKHGGLYQVFNLFTVLEDTEHENHPKVVESFSPTELEQLQKMLPYIQSMRNMYSHMFHRTEGLDATMLNNRVLDLFETMSSQGSSDFSDNYLHPNLSAIVAQTALEYAMTDGIAAFGYNKPEDIKDLVGEKLAGMHGVADALSSGSMHNQVVNRLGRQIVKRLGLTLDGSKASRDVMAQMETSIGHMALLGLMNSGLVEGYTFMALKDKQGKSHYTIIDGISAAQVPEGYTLDTKNTRKMVRFNEDKLNAIEQKTGKPIFEELSMDKSLIKKLYGEVAKNDVATEASEISVDRGNEEINTLVRTVAEKTPLFMHEGKVQMFENLSEEVQLEILKGNISTEGKHQSRHKSIEAKNRKAKATLARIRYTVRNVGEAGKYYLHQIVGQNLRYTGNSPKGIDPVNMAEARFLTNVAPTDTITFNSGDATLERVAHMFRKAILQNLDNKPEEKTPAQTVEIFDKLVANEAVQEAIALVAKAKEEKLSAEESARLMTLLKGDKSLGFETESPAHGLDAFHALANYQAAVQDGEFSFDGHVGIETDGKNNGSALGWLQNAPIASLEDALRMAKSVGLNFDDEAHTTFADLKAATEGFLDAYQHLAKASGQVGDKLAVNQIPDEHIEELLDNLFTDMPNRGEVYNQLLSLLVPQNGSSANVSILDDKGNVTSDGRQFFKDVLMTVLYGASVETQDSYFANRLVTTHLDSLEYFAGAENNSDTQTAFAEYIAKVNSLGLDQQIPLPNFKGNWQAEILAEKEGVFKSPYVFHAPAIKQLTEEKVANTIGVTYREALNTSTYKTIVDQAGSIAESANIKHMQTTLVINKLRAKYVASLGLDADAQLTANQESHFESTVVAPLMAKVEAPIGATSEGTSGTSGIDISRKGEARQEIPAREIEKAQAAFEKARAEGSTKIMQEFLPTKYREQYVQDVAAQPTTTTMRSQIVKFLMKSPELSTAPSLVHSLDSAIQLFAALSQNTPFINIFDAQLGVASTIANMGNTSNTSMMEVMNNFNIYEALTDAYKASDDAMADVLTEEEMEVVYTEIANALGLPDFNYKTYMADVRTSYQTIAKRAAKVQELLISTDQYPMDANTPLVNNNRNEESSLEAVQEEFKDSLDMDKLPKVVPDVPMNKSRDHAKNASVLLTAETDIVIDDINNDVSRYSVEHSVIGERYTAIMKQLADNIESVATFSPKQSKKLKGVAKALKQMMYDNRDRGLYVIPTTSLDTLFADIEQMLAESPQLSEDVKKYLLSDEGKLLLRTTDVMVTEDVRYTDNNAVNLWLNMEKNKKWMNKPISQLLSADFIDSITMDIPLGMNISGVEVFHAIITSPKSKAFIGNDVTGTNNEYFSKTVLEALKSMKTVEQRKAFYQATGILHNRRHWKALNRVPMFNNAMMDALIRAHTNPKIKFKLNILEKGALFDNVEDGFSKMNHLQKRVLRWYDKRGAFAGTNIAKADVRGWVFQSLFTYEEQLNLGLAKATKNVSNEKTHETDVDTRSEDNKTLEHTITYNGETFTLTGNNIQTYEINGGLAIDGEITAIGEFSNELEFVQTDVGGLIKPKLGTPTYDNTNNDTTYNEISNESVLETYDDIVSSSVTKDSSTHATSLRNLVSAMSTALHGIKIKIGDTTSAVSSGYFQNNTVVVTINKLLPRSVTNFMSAGEVMAHELVHAVTDKLADISPKLDRRAHELYRQAKAVMTWQDLIDPSLSKEDGEAVARKLYDYMFEGNTHDEIYVSKTTGLSKRRTVSGRPAEFMALMATNENVQRAGDKIIAQKTEYSGITARVIQVLNAAFDIFFKNARTESQTISQEMQSIVYQASKLQNNHRSVVSKVADSTSDIAEKGFEKTDSKIREFVQSTALWTVKQPVLGKGNWLNPKSYAAAAIGAPLLLLGNEEFRAKLSNHVRNIGVFQKRSILDVMNEIGSTTPNMNRVYSLISRRVQAIDQVRTATEANVSNYIANQMFKTEMSEKSAESLTKSIISTDLVTLVDQVGMDKALDVLSVDDKRLTSLRKAYQAKLKGFKYANYYINHAKALGEAMAKGNSVYYGVHSNAHSIARLAGDTEFGTPETDSLAEIEEAVDVLATLYAVMNTSKADRMAARNYLIKDNNHRKAQGLDTTDAKHVGFSALLAMHREVKQEALELNFDSNPMMVRKGYIREQYNPNVEIAIVAIDEVADYEKQGFEPVSKITEGVDTSESEYVLMTNPYSAKNSYDQGAFSHTGFNTMGTLFDESTPGNPANAQDNIDALNQDIILTDKGSIGMDKARMSMFTADPAKRNEVDGASLAPVRNDDGEIVGYRYTMSSEIKRKALQREERLPLVMARTKSSVEDKASSQEHNMVVLNEIYDILDEEYEAHPNEFMLVAPVEEGQPSTEESEMWAMLPIYTREAIIARNIERGMGATAGLYVPKRLATLLFGSAPITVSKMNNANNIMIRFAGSMMEKFMLNKYGKIAASTYKQALGTSKDTLVIKNVTTTLGNFVSNVFALSVAGIPQKHIMKKHVQGYKEIVQYQQLMHQISRVQQELTYTAMSEAKAKALRSQLADLEGRVSSLSILPLIDEGLYQTIVEDIDTAANETSWTTPLEEAGNNLLAKTGKAETFIREGVLITHDSETYRYLRDAAQVSDFVSRYVMYSYMTEEQGKPTEEAVQEARDTFIMYDAPMSKPLKALNDLGLFNFAKFLLRTQRVLGKNIRQNPSRTLMYSLLWGAMGASATMDVLMTPFNFGEMLLRRAVINPLGFLSNGLTELPILKILT
ncbi:coil containing protein [Vibrio phage 1.261.O._10N.286.51.A7]|uniref:Coil containing protein n=1 Tax=Vibrio phage 1.261.O._10N.286.51.A7 TaxID=1881237 RepID=A0A2I7RZH6_9CAUD|nr:coil containing protein [Vibrio phage 1.261.O._10N.286.51.A7]AUR99055.1 coil containing protein [Vibrio phage 1.261.O._10N.286.51.A7]